MMIRMCMLAGVFLCAWGWVCSDPAIAQELNGSTEQVTEADAEAPVRVSSFDTVQLNVRNADLASVLQLLSVQGRRNIVPSADVQGTVTANLYDVTFNEALDAILQQNGCGYIEKGNFVYVYTLEELRQIQQVERTLEYEVFKLNYITASDAASFITPLLSGAGSLSFSGDVGAGFKPSESDGGADSYANANILIVREYPDVLENVRQVIKDLDVPPKQVLVEATILKADLTEELAFGVDFSFLGAVDFNKFTNPLSAVTDILSGTVQEEHAVVGTSGVGNVNSGEGGLKLGIMSGNVGVFIRALDSVTDTVVLANPKLTILNRQRGEVLVGEKIGYLSTTATSTATTQTVEFLDTGTKLTVRPFVSDDGNIRMELRPSISEPRIRNVVPGTSQTAVTVPDEITQELTTNVMVRDGQTIVLGGLFKEKTTIDRNQVPLLGDIPVAGAAFKGRDDTVNRSEVIFLITPHIVKDKAIYAAGDAATEMVEMARIGAREGLLPWSRSKMTAAHLRDALRYMEADQREKALWEVDLALGLDPTQVEAIRLKEKLTSERAYWPSRSMIDDAVDVMVDRQTGKRRQERRLRPMVPDPHPTRSTSEPGLAAPADGTSDATHDPAAAPADLMDLPDDLPPVDQQVWNEEGDDVSIEQVSDDAASEADLWPDDSADTEPVESQPEAAATSEFESTDGMDVETESTEAVDQPAAAVDDPVSSADEDIEWGAATPLPAFDAAAEAETETASTDVAEAAELEAGDFDTETTRAALPEPNDVDLFESIDAEDDPSQQLPQSTEAFVDPQASADWQQQVDSAIIGWPELQAGQAHPDGMTAEAGVWEVYDHPTYQSQSTDESGMPKVLLGAVRDYLEQESGMSTASADQQTDEPAASDPSATADVPEGEEPVGY